MSQPRGRAVPPAPGGNQPGKEAGAGARAARWGLRSLAGPGTSRAGRGHGGSPSGPRAWRGRRSARGRAAGGRQQVRGRRAAARGPAPGPPLTSALALALALALAGGTHKMADAAFGAGTQHRRVASGAVFILPSTRPVVARAPSALEADGNFCGLNTGLRRAGLFGLAALPPRPVPHPFMPRPGPPPLLQAWGLCPPSLAAVALRGLCRPGAGLPGPPPQVRKRLRVPGLPARACASQTGAPLTSRSSSTEREPAHRPGKQRSGAPVSRVLPSGRPKNSLPLRRDSVWQDPDHWEGAGGCAGWQESTLGSESTARAPWGNRVPGRGHGRGECPVVWLCSACLSSIRAVV